MLRTVRLLANERPQFISLNVLGMNVADFSVKDTLTGIPRPKEPGHDRVAVHSCQAFEGANGLTFTEATQDRQHFIFAQHIHLDNSLDKFMEKKI